jgi:hypothetical protein
MAGRLEIRRHRCPYQGKMGGWDVRPKKVSTSELGVPIFSYSPIVAPSNQWWIALKSAFCPSRIAFRTPSLISFLPGRSSSSPGGGNFIPAESRRTHRNSWRFPLPVPAKILMPPVRRASSAVLGESSSLADKLKLECADHHLRTLNSDLYG